MTTATMPRTPAADFDRRTAVADPHGRHAEKPLDIPLRGWRSILTRVYKNFDQNRIMLVAAGTTFYLLLAMVPALTALISIYGLFNDPASAQQHLAFIQSYLPDGGRQILDEQLGRIAGQAETRLGFALAISVGIALWSANAGMKALLEAMNVAYGETEKRGFVKLTLTSLAFTLGAIVLLLALIGVMLLLPAVLDIIGLGGSTGLWVQLASGAVLALAAITALSALYRWGPSRENASWRWITPGAIVALIVAFIASTLFSWYVSRFGSYNETYGSLGAIIGFMTWLWIMVAFIVTGGELNAEMEHQTARDTTTGPELPLGHRGAEMADSVATGPDDVPDEGSPGLRRAPPKAEARAQSGAAVARGPAADPAGSGDGAAATTGRAVGGTHGGSGGPFGLGGLLLTGGIALAVLASDIAAGRDGGPIRPQRGGGRTPRRPRTP